MAEWHAGQRCLRDSGGLTNSSRRGAARMAMQCPQLRASLFQYIGEDARLADLCDAYETACAAREYWLHSSADIGSTREHEYRTVAAEVAGEIIAALADR
jgi:hypothetical protein